MSTAAHRRKAVHKLEGGGAQQHRAAAIVGQLGNDPVVQRARIEEHLGAGEQGQQPAAGQAEGVEQGQGIEELKVALEAAMVGSLQPIQVLIPYNRGDLLSLFHERGQVDGEDHGADGFVLYGRLPARLLPYFEPYQIK